MLYLNQVEIHAVFGVFNWQALPDFCPLAIQVVFVETGFRFSAKAVLLEKPIQDVIGLVIAIVSPHICFDRYGDFYA